MIRARNAAGEWEEIFVFHVAKDGKTLRATRRSDGIAKEYAVEELTADGGWKEICEKLESRGADLANVK